MTEKRTLSRWLRNEDVYDVMSSDVRDAPDKPWREALLMELHENTARPMAKAQPAAEESSSLQIHQALWLSLAGLGLFCLGWLFGNGVIAMQQISKISPWLWMSGSLVLSVGFWSWRGLGVKGRN